MGKIVLCNNIMFAHSRKAHRDLAHTIEIAVTQTQKWNNCAESDGVDMNALSPRRLPLSVCVNFGQDISFLHACKQPGNEASCRYYTQVPTTISELSLITSLVPRPSHPSIFA